MMRRDGRRSSRARGLRENFPVLVGPTQPSGGFARTEMTRGGRHVEFAPCRFLRSSSNGSHLRRRSRYETQCSGMGRACRLRRSPGQFTRFHPRRARRARRSRPRARRRLGPCPRRSRRSPTSSGRRWSRSASSARRASAPSGAAAAMPFPGSPKGRTATSIPRTSRRCSSSSSAPMAGPRSSSSAGCRGDRLGIRLRRQGPHPDQQPRRRRLGQDHRHLPRRRRGAGHRRRDRPGVRRRRHQGGQHELPSAPQGLEQQAAGRRAGSWPWARPSA